MPPKNTPTDYANAALALLGLVVALIGAAGWIVIVAAAAGAALS